MALKEIQKFYTIQLIKKRYGRMQKEDRFEGIPDSIALMAQERFGDIIMMSPLLRLLKKHYPQTQIYIISVNSIADYLRFDANIEQVLKAKHPSPETKRTLKSLEFDILFNTKDHPSVTFLYLTRKIKAKHRVGIAHPQHEGFFNHVCPVPQHPQKTVLNYFTLLEYLGIPYSEKDQIPYLPQGPVTEEIKDFIQTRSEQQFNAINLSASQHYKEWPLERWMDFLKSVEQKSIVIAMPKHHQQKQLLENTFHNIIPSPPTKSIFDAGALIKNSKMLISPDTALVHIASCFNTPTLALYRQELDLQNFPPLSFHHEVLMSPGSSISDISSTQVLRAYQKLSGRI